ncbi:MAG: PAS domain-containing protein [Rhizobiaceae bacterium]|nr:PAS domain-containing protein [Rhizobiaceae bacterium]
MKHEGSVSLFQYWNRLRGKRHAPRRTEIEPADIKANLADTFILEQDAQGEALYRLAGTRLCAAFGRELKGASFVEHWIEKDRRILARLVHGAFRLNNVVVVNFVGASEGGRTNDFEMLILPLDGGQQNMRALGSISAMEKPFWLGADPISQCRIQSLRIIDPTVDSIFLQNRPEVKVPPLAPVEAMSPEPGRRVRHLVVLEGGREE